MLATYAKADSPNGLVTRIRPPERQPPIDLQELWRAREILFFLIWRDISVRYKQTLVGVAWAVLQPLCMTLVFVLVFGGLVGIDGDGVPYPLLTYAGLLPWSLFATSVQSASQSLVTQAPLLTKVYMPRLFLPATGVGVALVDSSLSFAMLLLMLLVYGFVPGASFVLAPLLLVLTGVLAYGVSLLLASVAVFYRDVRIAVPFVLQLWMFLTPIVYPETLLQEKLGAWYVIAYLNPMTGVVSATRACLLGTDADLVALSSSIVMALVFLVVGARNFKRAERSFADLA